MLCQKRMLRQIGTWQITDGTHTCFPANWKYGEISSHIAHPDEGHSYHTGQMIFEPVGLQVSGSRLYKIGARMIIAHDSRFWDSDVNIIISDRGLLTEGRVSAQAMFYLNLTPATPDQPATSIRR